MRFTKKDNIYRISRITGSQDNILGVYFTENGKNNNENNIAVIEQNGKNSVKIQTSKDEV